jgi:bla regulator protein BlaR1
VTNSSLLSAGSAIGNHLWQTTVFTAAIGLLALFLRNNPARIRYSLWLAASAKFLLPFSLLIALGSLLPKSHGIAPPGMYSAMSLAGEPFSDLVPAPQRRPPGPQLCVSGSYAICRSGWRVYGSAGWVPSC